MDKREAIEKVKKYAVLINKNFTVKKVILFGSYARGNAHEHSDIDVAIVVKNIDREFFDYAPLLWGLREEIDSLIEPVLIEEDHDESGFLEEIYKNGIIIYNSQASA